jgi:hypothetical protein
MEGLLFLGFQNVAIWMVPGARAILFCFGPGASSGKLFAGEIRAQLAWIQALCARAAVTEAVKGGVVVRRWAR